MKAEEFLKRAADAERRVEAAVRKVELYKAMAEKVTSSIGGEQVSHTRDVTANENAILRVIEAQERVEQLQAEYQSIVNEIVDTLNKLENRDMEEILSRFYLGHLSMAAIAADMHTSRSYIYKYFNLGLNALEKVLPKN